MDYEEVLTERFHTPFNKAERRLMQEGNSLYKAGKLEEALGIYERLLEAHPSSVSLLVTIADLYTDFYRFDEAIDLFKKAVGIQPRSEKISRGLMHILWSQKREEDAVKEIQRFIDTGEASKEYIDIALEIIDKKGAFIRISDK